MIKKILCALALMAVLTGTAAADDLANVTKVLERLIPGKQPDAIADSVIPDLFQAVYGPDVIYISRDGRYVVQGDVISADDRQNLTERIRSAARLKLINAVDPKSMIVFAPRHVKHTVTVFTDVDCAFCRKLHSQIAEYNSYGIAIRYLAFPRTGVNTESYYKAVTVWCSDDRRAALTEAKLGDQLPRKTCDNPVREQMALADKLGVDATPTLILEDGSLVSGYIPPKQMSQMLDQLAAAKP